MFERCGLSNYKLNKNYKGVELAQDLCYRVWTLLDDLKKNYPDKNILLVTHGGVISAINGYFNGLENDCLPPVSVDNCEIIEYVI